MKGEDSHNSSPFHNDVAIPIFIIDNRPNTIIEVK